MNVKIRKALKKDIPDVIGLIKELAEYENSPDEVSITKEQLIEDGFGDKPVFEIILAEYNNIIIGISFYYISYSTWKGKCLYLEDIIVTKDYRRKGIGKLLFEATKEKAHKIKAKRMQWQVLNWNKPAIEFYKKYNSDFDNEWINCKLIENQIQ